MVTKAKKPRAPRAPRAPRKKRVTKHEESEPKEIAAPASFEIAPEENEDDAPLPGSYRNEPEEDGSHGGETGAAEEAKAALASEAEPAPAPVLAPEPVPEPKPAAAPVSDATRAAMAADESSEEPDFGLGIGEMLRSDTNVKRDRVSPETAAEAAAKRDRADAAKLSIDAILRGEAGSMTGPMAVPASLREVQPEEDQPEEEAAEEVVEAEEEGGAMDPYAERRNPAKTFMMILVVMILFSAAAGGVYVFLSKNGLPSFLTAKQGTPTLPDDQVPVNNAPQQPQVPETATTTVLVGLKAPETEGTKPFLVSRVVESDGKTSGTFTATGKASSKTDRSTGTVTITNTTSREYTFVATTRVLSKEGVLFRLKSSTAIPANGSVDAVVVADQPGAEGDIGPSTFTIPGLSYEQQKLITAKSEAAMTGGAGTEQVGVSQADIDAAKAALTEKLRDEALENFEVMLQEGEVINADLMTSKELSAVVPKVGTAGATFTVTLSLRVQALLIPQKDVMPLLDQAMAEALPVNVSVVDYATGSVHYTVQAYDTAAGIAEVRAEAPIIRQ